MNDLQPPQSAPQDESQNFVLRSKMFSVPPEKRDLEPLDMRGQLHLDLLGAQMPLD